MRRLRPSRNSAPLWILATACIACVTGVSGALAPVEDQYDLPRLIQAALLQSAELETIQSQADASLVKRSHLSRWDAPEIRIGYGRDTNTAHAMRSSDYPNQDYDASLRIFPRNPWEVNATREKLLTSARLIQFSKAAAAQALSQNVASLYWDFCYTRLDLSIQKQLLEIRKEQVENIEALLESGQVSLAQSLPPKMDLINCRIQLEALIQKELEVRAELSQITGVHSDSFQIHPPQSIPLNAFERPFDSWIHLAIDNRLEIDVFDSEIEYTQAELSEIKARDIPWIKHIQANYEVRNHYGDRDSAGLEVAFSIPFLTGDEGHKKIARATLNRQQSQRFQEVKIIEAEVRILIERFAAFKQLWTLHSREIKPLADSLQRSVNQMNAQGIHSNRNYWDARIAILELRQKDLHMRRRYQQLQIEAKAVLGEPI